jgi:hypothetical protein
MRCPDDSKQEHSLKPIMFSVENPERDLFLKPVVRVQLGLQACHTFRITGLSYS